MSLSARTITSTVPIAANQPTSSQGAPGSSSASIPMDFGQKEVDWALTTRGHMAKAHGSLRTDYPIENIDILSETGALGAGTSSPEVRADKPPIIKLEGTTTRTVKAGEPLSLSATVTTAYRKHAGLPSPAPQRRRGLSASARPRGTGAERGRDPAFIPPSRVTVTKTVGLHFFGSSTAERARRTSNRRRSRWADTRTGANSP
jgi:hypothetical protein